MTNTFTVEDELRLTCDLAFAIAESDGELGALAAALACICRATDWQMGQAWIPSPQGLRCSPAWHCDENMRESVRDFRAVSENTVLAEGIGLPGLVWQTRRGEWVLPQSGDQNPIFTRLQVACDAGIKVALAVPVASDEEIVAVFEFFSSRERDENQQLLDLVSSVAVRLGSLLLRKRATQTLRESEAELQALVRAIDDLVIVADSQMRYVRIAPTNNQLLYRPAEEMIGKTMSEVLPPPEAALFQEAITRVLQSRQTAHIEYSLPIAGEMLWFSANISPMGDDQVLWVARDITQRKVAEVKLAQAEENYRGIFLHALEGIFQTDKNGRYLSANPALARIYGYDSVDELMDGLIDIAQQLYTKSARRDEFARLLANHDMVSKFESQVRRKDGTVIWISENARAVRDQNGDLLYYEGTVEDITERKWRESQLEEQQLRLQEINFQLQALATLDSLTGLKNHRALQEALLRECERARREKKPLSLLLLDVDKFKKYNDSFGHPAGDAVLRQLARILLDNARDTDFVARYGGEEFAILLPGANAASAFSSAERFRHSLENAPWPERAVTASFGIATLVTISTPTAAPVSEEAQDDNALCTSLMMKADKALYWSKTSGRNRTTHSDDLPQ